MKKFFTKGKDYAKVGRPGYDYVMMFKILILQGYYDLSNEETEFAIRDRLSFMQFLGLSLSDKGRSLQNGSILQINGDKKTRMPGGQRRTEKRNSTMCKYSSM